MLSSHKIHQAADSPGNTDLSVRQRLPTVLLVEQKDRIQESSAAHKEQNHHDEEQIDDLFDVGFLHDKSIIRHFMTRYYRSAVELGTSGSICMGHWPSSDHATSTKTLRDGWMQGEGLTAHFWGSSESRPTYTNTLPSAMLLRVSKALREAARWCFEMLCRP